MFFYVPKFTCFSSEFGKHPMRALCRKKKKFQRCHTILKNSKKKSYIGLVKLKALNIFSVKVFKRPYLFGQPVETCVFIG